jgi:transcriptional regulator with XRE-family HTH domain
MSSVKRTHAYSRTTTETARHVGDRVRLGRVDRRWTAQELADRLGVSRATIRKIESGDPTVGLGVAIEACVLVGAPLLAGDEERRPRDRGGDVARSAVAPQRVRARKDIDDDF